MSAIYGSKIERKCKGGLTKTRRIVGGGINKFGIFVIGEKRGGSAITMTECGVKGPRRENPTRMRYGEREKGNVLR
jgi:hypothetical protein